MMADLIVHRGDNNYCLHTVDETTYVYNIGSGKVVGQNLKEINDAKALNDTTLAIRGDYVEWVFGLNKIFLDKGLVRDNSSLFFWTDLSNKRNELFDTYETLANVSVIKQQLKDVDIKSILLIGTDTAFEETMRSCFTGAKITIKSRAKPRVYFRRRVLADIKYLGKIIEVIIINKIVRPRLKKKTGESKKCLFSFYPQTFTEQFEDIRYGEYVSEQDQYVVTLVADGMHQQISAAKYFREIKKLPKNRFVVIDSYLGFKDVLTGLKWWFKLCINLGGEWNRRYYFRDLDITRHIRQELIWSISRVMRLIVISGALKKLLPFIDAKELVYIVFEYPFGRMISQVCKSVRPDIVRIGFNHGDYSWRFINYFLAKGEASNSMISPHHCPIPDKVLAEDDLCKEIYEFNGYQCVEKMSQVYRLKYLDHIKPTKDKGCVLIAAGLHDGKALLSVLMPEIKLRLETIYFFKPHPRGDNSYIKELPDQKNLKVVTESIDNVLAKAGEVYVTYSGIGVEALRLGIPVQLISIPGKINWSKLLDDNYIDRGLESAVNSTPTIKYIG